MVGIDVGTQSCKAVVCDEGLAVRGAHAVGYPTSFPRADHAEQDPRTWEAALGPAIAGALAAADAKPEDIIALAIVGQLDGCIGVDANCTPLHPALIWQDRRAVAESKRAPAAQVFSLTGQVADPSHFAPKVAWLRAGGVEAARWHQPVSYLVERLTGAAVFDLSLASSCMLLELSTGMWAPVLLEAFELTPKQLPRIRPTCEIAGTLTSEGARLTGLRTGTRVAVGTGDDFANPLGAGIVAPGPIAVALGTAEVVGAVSPSLVLDRTAEPMVETHAYPTGAFFVENPGWLSGGAIHWAVQLLGLRDPAALDALAVSVPSSDGVTFVPALAGAMTPVWRPHARGTLHGLAAGHGPAHVARAVLEGLAFACRDVIDRLRELGLANDRVVLIGGGAQSALWAQLRANATGLRHDVIANPDTSPIAAAMIASVAAGWQANLASAASSITPAHTTYQPLDRLDAAYARYQRLVVQLLPLADRPWRDPIRR